MSQNLNQPRKEDTVLGGKNPPPVAGVVLGGLEGVKQCLLSSIVEQRIAALKEALNYGEEGLELVIQALKDESDLVQNRAYSILLQREEPGIKQVLLHYKPWQFFEYLRTTSGHSSAINDSVISSDGQMLITNVGGDIRVWDLETGLQIHRLSGYRNTLIHPDEYTLASWSTAGKIKVWDLKTGQLIRTVGEYSRNHTSVVISSNWQKVLCVEYKTIYERDLNTGQLIRTIKIHLGKLSAIALAPDGETLAGGSFDNSIRIWDLRTKREIHTLKGHLQSVCFLAFSPDGKTLVSAGDKTIKVWKWQTEKLIHTFTGHQHKIISVAISLDWRTLLSSGTDSTIIKWDLNTGQKLRVFQEDSDTVCSLNICHPGNTFISTGNYKATVWDLQTGKLVKSLSLMGHLGSISSLAVSPDGLTIYSSGGGDKTIKLWDARTGQIITNFHGHLGAVSCLCLSLNGELLASSSYDTTIKLWDVRKGQEICTLVGHASSVLCIAIDSNGQRLVSGDRDGNIKIWNLSTRKEIYTLQQRCLNDYRGVFRLAISPDGKTLVSCSCWSYPVATVWNLETGEEIYSLPQHPVQYIAISPDGQILVSGDESYRATIKVCDLKTGQEIRTFPGRINCLAISPDGQALFLGSEDRTIKIWDLKTGELIRSLKGHPFCLGKGGNVLAISGNGQTLVSGNGGNVNIWGLRSADG